MHSWIDGQPGSAVNLQNRGLAYGDGLFETIAVRVAIDLDVPLARDELLAYAAQLGEGVVKLMVTRGDSPRGYAPAPGAPARRILQNSPLPAYPAAHAEQGISLFDCQTRLARQPLLAGLKHLNRLEQVLARAEWQDPAYAEGLMPEGLMRDAQGLLIEGVYSNLFLVRDGVLTTPELSHCGVAGVMRSELLDQARALGIEACTAELGQADLQQADDALPICSRPMKCSPATASTVSGQCAAFPRSSLTGRPGRSPVNCRPSPVRYWIPDS